MQIARTTKDGSESVARATRRDARTANLQPPSTARPSIDSRQPGGAMQWKAIFRSVLPVALALLSFACAHQVPDVPTPRRIINRVDTCVEIDSVPFTIDKPGDYCLVKSLTLEANTGNAIAVLASNVRIDGKGHCLSGSKANDTSARGVFALDQSSIAVRDLCVRGFEYGIIIGETVDSYVADGDNYGRFTVSAARDIVIERVSIERPSFQGIHVRASSNVVVRDSSVVHVGGTSLTPHAFATGIYIQANNCSIDGNRVFGLYPSGSGEGVGISLYHGRGCRVTNNSVQPLHDSKYGRVYGFWIRPGRGEMPLLTGNVVQDADYSFGPWGVYERNTSIDATCASFVNRRFSLPDNQLDSFLAERDTNVVRSHLRRPCPDVPSRRITLACEEGTPEAVYSVATSLAEADPIECRVEQLAWIIVASEYGHAEAIRAFEFSPTAANSELDFEQALLEAATVRTLLQKCAEERENSMDLTPVH